MLRIKTNIITGTRKCEFEHNNQLYYAFQPSSCVFTTVYKGNPNIMLGEWVMCYADTDIKAALDMFLMDKNEFQEVNTYNYKILPEEVKNLDDYKKYWKENKETVSAVMI